MRSGHGVGTSERNFAGQSVNSVFGRGWPTAKTVPGILPSRSRIGSAPGSQPPPLDPGTALFWPNNSRGNLVQQNWAGSQRHA